jgi:hypothetical protein
MRIRPIKLVIISALLYSSILNKESVCTCNSNDLFVSLPEDDRMLLKPVVSRNKEL